jgi:hypothetical protein
MSSPAIGWGVRFVVGRALAYWLDHGGLALFESSSESENLTGRKAVMVFQRPEEAHLSTRDTMLCSTHWVKPTTFITGDDWTNSDHAAVSTGIQGFVTAMKDRLPSNVVLTEIRIYAAGPAYAPVPHVDPDGVTRPHAPASPILYSSGPLAIRGTGTGDQLPPQVACNVTLRTGSRRHWGRFALPGLETQQLASGRWSTAAVDDIANAWLAAAATLAFAGYLNVVYSPAGLAWLGVTSVECDDVPDVIRLRRFATTGYRKILSTA